MPVKEARESGRNFECLMISSAQAGNGVSTDVGDRGPSHKGAILRFTTTIGATPTCTYQIEVSADGTNWAAATYSDISTPTVNTTATFVITTATVVQKIVKQPTPWRYVRVTYSANTNVTNTCEVLYDESQTPPWTP